MTGRMLAFARSREAGVRDDIDTEFLHAYRVSIRKIRSVLGQLKGALPPTETEDLKRSLSALAQRTNRLRDLDVYLLAREQYLHLVPASLQPGLETMFRDFERERSREYGAVRRYLRSKSHARLMERLERITDGRRRMPDSGNAAVAVGELAARHIRKRHAKIAHAGAAIDRQTPDQELHDLRIECKKLRYLLELFESLFARQDVTAAVARLKRLQDALGTFNDLCVQQAELVGYLQTQQHGEAPDAALAASIGGLLGALHQQQQNQREQVIAEVNEFCTGRVGLLFERLYQQYEKRRK
jgi:CHAD domain-containing protein